MIEMNKFRQFFSYYRACDLFLLQSCKVVEADLYVRFSYGLDENGEVTFENRSVEEMLIQLLEYPLVHLLEH